MCNLIKVLFALSVYLFGFLSANLYGSKKEFFDDIDTFTGYLRINRKDISISGPNGMNIDLIHSYTGSRLLVDDLSSGYGWHLNNMQLVINAEYIKKKKKSSLSKLFTLNKSKNKPYGFHSYSAKLIFPNGLTKDFAITNYINNGNHSSGFHYSKWPEKMESSDNWLIINPENSHNMFLYDPNGRKYTLSVDVSNANFNLSARLTKVEDLNGNWIQYNYANIAPEKYPNLIKSYLKSITSNDGREINFDYIELHVGNRTPHFIVLDKVIVNNKTWQYKYKVLTLKHNSNRVPVLSEIIRPDGSLWQYTYNQSTKNSRLLTQVKAPNGLITKYDYQYYKKDNKDFEKIAAKYSYDPKYNLLGAVHYHIDQEKVGCDFNKELVCVKNYVETDFGRKEYIYATANLRIKKYGKNFFGPIWSHGKLIQKEIKDYKLDKVLENIKYEWDSQLIDNNLSRAILIKKIQNRDNTNYITNYLEHDNFGRARVVKEVGPSGQIQKSYNYIDYKDTHVYNLLTSYVNGESFKKYKYNSKGQLINKNINNINFYYDYHNTGDLASVTDSKEYTTKYNNYFRGKPGNIIYADNSKKIKAYDTNGLLISNTDERGFTTNYHYDNLGRIIKIYPPKGASQEIYYYSNYTVKQKGNYKKIIEYDYFNNLKSIAKFDNAELLFKKKYNYDFLGRKIFTSKKNNNSYGNQDDGVYKSYDAINRVSLVKHKSKNENLIFKYNYLQKNGIEIINPQGNKKISYYQAYGSSKYKNLIELIDANDVHTVYKRSQDGLINKITRENISRNYYYNDQRLLSEYSDPETGVISFKYNLNGKLNVTWIADRYYTLFYYDKRNRIIMKHYNDSRSDYYCYDEVGNLIRSRTNNSEWLYQYDENNNLKQASFALRFEPKKYVFNYEYDELNNLSSIEYPSSKKIYYNPDALGKPRQVGSYVNNINYYSNSKIKSFNYHNGIVYNSSLNKRGDIESISYISHDLIKLDYDYDELNNIIKIDDNRTDSNFFKYDKINRLVESYNSKKFDKFTYDIYDNILKKISNNMESNNEYYSYDINNRLISISSDKAYEYQYDLSGRVLSDGIHNYSYNTKNQISKIDNKLYLYDANNHKISDSSKNYLHDRAGKKLVEFDDSGNYKEYYYLNYNIIAKSEFNINSEKHTYFHFDKFNSLLASSDQDGKIIKAETQDFFANGIFKENFGNIYDNNGRIFNGNISRFLNADIFKVKNLKIFNRYNI